MVSTLAFILLYNFIFKRLRPIMFPQAKIILDQGSFPQAKIFQQGKDFSTKKFFHKKRFFFDRGSFP